MLHLGQAAQTDPDDHRCAGKGGKSTDDAAQKTDRDDDATVVRAPCDQSAHHSITSAACPCAACRRRSASKKKASPATTRSHSCRPESTTMAPKWSPARSATCPESRI